MQTNIQASIGNCPGDSPWKPATTSEILMAVSTKVANHAQATNCRVVIWLDKDQVLPVKTPLWSVKKKRKKKVYVGSELTFTFSRELKNWSFHVVVVHRWWRNWQRARCICKAVALLNKLAAFLTFSVPEYTLISIKVAPVKHDQWWMIHAS